MLAVLFGGCEDSNRLMSSPPPLPPASPPESVLSSGPRNDPVLLDLGIGLEILDS